MSPLRAAIEATAIIVCMMLAVMFFAWALNKTLPEGNSLDTTPGFASASEHF